MLALTCFIYPVYQYIIRTLINDKYRLLTVLSTVIPFLSRYEEIRLKQFEMQTCMSNEI